MRDFVENFWWYVAAGSLVAVPAGTLVAVVALFV